MNVSKPPFDDIRVRRALNLTIDRQQWRDLIYRGAGYLMGPIGAKVAWGAWSQEKLESLPGLRGGAAKQQDIEEAKRLIREATGRDTISITMSTTTTTPSEQEQLLQFMLRKAGIELRLQTVAAGVDTRSTQATAQWQLNRVSAGGGITPDQALFQIYRSDAPEHSMQWFDTTLDRLADEQARTLDFEKRKQLLDQIQQYIWDNAVFAPDVRFLFRWIAWNYVKNWAGPDHTHNYRAAQIEEVWIAR
jgi:peptide/nickel transport system substrate-binding protein